MYVMHIALGGCLRAPPVAYGLTEDTGGHIAYVLGAAAGQARRSSVRRIDIVTRAFHDPRLGDAYSAARERVDGKTTVVRLSTDRRDYLAKGDLDAELPALRAAFPGPPRPSRSSGRHPRPFRRRGRPGAGGPPPLGRARDLHPAFAGAGTGRHVRASVRPDRPGARRHRARRPRSWCRRATRRTGRSRPTASRTAGRVLRINPGVYLAGDTGGTDRAEALIDGHLDDPSLPLILAVARPVPKKNLGGLLDA